MYNTYVHVLCARYNIYKGVGSGTQYYCHTQTPPPRAANSYVDILTDMLST